MTVSMTAECLRTDCNILGDKIKKTIHFMEPEYSLWHSQVPATCPYPEPAQTNHTQTPLPEDPSYYYPPIYGWVS